MPMPEKKKAGSPNAIDKLVGSRVKMRRLMLGLSQDALGKALGLSFQQIQKYEKGVNRIGASRLQQIAIVLDVPVAFFFEGLPAPGESPSNRPGYIDDFVTSEEGLAVAKAMMRITERPMRVRFASLLVAIAEKYPEATK